MKEIILIRHGVSARSNLPKQSAIDYMAWKDEYDQAGVLESDGLPFRETVSHIARASRVFTSGLYRTRHSMLLLQPDMQAVHEELFNEVDFRCPRWRGVRLSTRLWSGITGICWYSGFVKERETKAQVRHRAKLAADMLEEAAEDGIAALVGHGFFNLFLYQELKRRSWTVVQGYTSRNWSCTRLQK